MIQKIKIWQGFNYRMLVYALIAAISLVLISAWIIGGRLIAAVNQKVILPKSETEFQTVTIPHHNTFTQGWIANNQNAKGSILLLHSVRSNRIEMLPRAKFLLNSGYNVLLIDLQAHGETPGEMITFGVRESLDVHSAVEFLKRKFPFKPVAIIGQSLGGAASLLGEKPAQVDALILEAVYSSIDKAVENRVVIRFGELGRYLAKLLIWQIEPRLDIKRDKLSPLSAIKQLSSPVMIISGDQDQHTLLEETQLLYAATSQPKSLWIVKGAKHQDLYAYAPQVYQAKLLAFLEQHMKVNSQLGN